MTIKRPMNIYSQKGCVWRSQDDGGCIFCSIPYYDLRLREPKLVWDEISFLVEKYQTDLIWDPSDNLIGDKEWFKGFCAAKPKALDIRYTNYVDAKGIDEEVAAEALLKIKQLHTLKLDGLHVFAASGVLRRSRVLC